MKRILYLLTLVSLNAFSQVPAGWHHLDPSRDSLMGISTLRAYGYLNARPSDTVIVAIIDNGAEITHEDLRDVIWVNRDEIPGDSIDNDNNGYIDDIHGLNFLGNAKGENIKREQTELTRCYVVLEKQFGSIILDPSDTILAKEYERYLEIKKAFLAERKQKNDDIAVCERIIDNLKTCNKIISDFLKKDPFTIADVRQIVSSDKRINNAKKYLLMMDSYKITIESCAADIRSLRDDLDTRLNPGYDIRQRVIGDSPDDISDAGYGNNNVGASGPFHGTGVASVVGAVCNGKGVDGIAHKVKLMIIRIVPNGDEQDKDFYLAVKYAVDNGASIINCSFAKKYSMHPEFARMAVSLAEEKGVLIVNGAGNDASDTGVTRYFPDGTNMDGVRSDIWITVGSSMPFDNADLIASFSNYGKTSVDLFAPGYDVDNCELRNGYGKGSGTSISAPVVSGIAAVLKSYYPFLKASEIKHILLQSVYVPATTVVTVPGSEGKKMAFKDLSVSGGIANLFNAIVYTENNFGKQTSLFK